MSTDTLDTNLLATGKKNQPPKPIEKPKDSRKKKIIKITAYVGIFFFSLVFFFSLKLPDSLVTNLIINQVNHSSPFRLQAKNLKLKFFLLPHLYAENLELDPKNPHQGISLAFDEASIYPNIFSLIPWTGHLSPSASFSVRAYKSAFEGKITASDDPYMKINSERVDLSALDFLANDSGVKGILENLNVELAAEAAKASKSDGLVSFKGKNLVVDPAAFGVPIPLPILNFGPADVQVRVTKGRARFEKFILGGKDLELRLSGDITLSDYLAASRADLRLQIKLSPSILSAVAGIESLLTTMAAKRPDGFYAMKISGTFNAMGLPTPDP